MLAGKSLQVLNVLKHNIKTLPSLLQGSNEDLLLITSYIVPEYDLSRLFYLILIYTCVLLLDVFNTCSLVQLKKKNK